MEKKMDMRSRISRSVGQFIVNYRVPVVIVSLILTIIFAYGIKRLNFSVKLEDMLPPTDPFVKLDQTFGKMFGSYDFFIVQVSVKKGDVFTYRTLSIVKDLTDDIYFLPSVNRGLVWSLTLNKCKEIRGKSKEFYVNAFMWPHIPKTSQGLDRVKQAVLTSDIYGPSLVSKDAKATLITGYVKKDYDPNKFFSSLMKLKHKYEKQDPNIEIKMVGRPILMGWIYHFFPEMFLIFGITIMLSIGLLSISFRSWQGLAVPIFAGLLSTVWGLGIMGLLGINLDPLMVVLPFVVGARALSFSIQITSRYLEEYAHTEDAKEATYRTIDAMLLPNAGSIVTDIAGFMTLALASILVIQNIGISMSLWMVAIYFVTGILIPIICFYMPPLSKKRLAAIRASAEGKGDIVDRLLEGIARVSITGGVRVAIVVVMLGIIAGSSYVIVTKGKVGDLSPGTPVLWEDSEYNRAVEEINKNYMMAGSDRFQLFIEAEKPKGILAPEVLRLQTKLDNFYRKHFPDTYAGSSNVDTIVKTIHRELYEGDPAFYSIPRSLPAVGTCLGFYLNKLNPGDFDSYASPDLKYGNMTFYFKNHMPDTVEGVVNQTREFLKAQKPLPGAKVVMCGGNIGIEYALIHELERVHFQLIGGVLLLIFVLIVATYRSLMAGILLLVPLLASNGVAMAFLALFGIGESIDTLPVVTVGLGIGINFGFFLYSRYIEEYNIHRDIDKAVRVAGYTAGKGVFFTGITLVIPLSLWYLISSIRFHGVMGLFLGLLLAVNLIFCLFFHPAVTSLLKPKFVTESSSESE